MDLLIGIVLQVNLPSEANLQEFVYRMLWHLQWRQRVQRSNYKRVGFWFIFVSIWRSLWHEVYVVYYFQIVLYKTDGLVEHLTPCTRNMEFS